MLALGGMLVALALGACGGSGPTTAAVTAGSTQTASAATTTTTAPPRTTATTTTPRRRHAPKATRPRRVAPAPAHRSPAHTTPAPRPSAPKHRASRPRPTTTTIRKPGPVAHPVDETAQLVLVSSPGPGRYEQQGTVTGTFNGTMTLRARITAAGVVVDFTADVTGGIVTGHGLAIPTITGGSPVATLKGTASVTGGTGTFAHVRGSKLKVTGTAVLPSGSKATVHLTGTVTY